MPRRFAYCAANLSPQSAVRGPLWLSLSALLATSTIACGGDDGGGGTIKPPDGRVRDSRLIELDSQQRDLAAAPDLTVNTEGPTIEILSPEADATVVGGVLRVSARVSDTDGIDAQTVSVQLQGQDTPLPLGVTVTPQVYEARIDVRSLSGPARLWVVATDLLGNSNSSIREFRRDAGPAIRFLSPEEQSRHKGSVSLQVVVADSSEITDFTVRLGNRDLTLTETVRQDNQTVYATTLAFDDPAFGAPLSGRQVLTATAVNANGARRTLTRTFFVDDQGPAISVLSQSPGDLIGGVIEIQIEVTDLAGVNAATVSAVVGNELVNQQVELRQDPTDAKTFRGEFDTANLSDEQIWPVMSFRAEDVLGNPSHYDFEVALDNGPPVVSLDPPDNFVYWRKKEDVIQCSHPFDPLGGDAVNDLDQVAQAADFRVRVEDQGNFVLSTWTVLSGIAPSSVRLYLLPASTAAPLVIDSDDDGWCDAINPNVLPSGSDPQPGQAIGLSLSSVGVAGAADYTPYTLASQLESRCESPGDADAPPEPLCDSTAATVAIHDNTPANGPAIWSIPPVVGSDALRCMGLPFDFRNEIPNGWVCAAAVARDELGTQGVSRPIRVWWDRDNEPSFQRPAPAGVPDPPDCTGTVDPNSGAVTDVPCTWRKPFGPYQELEGKSCTRDDECCAPNGSKGCGRYVGRCLTGAGSQRFCVAKWPQIFPEWEVRED
jgi:hypothetical protein